MIRVRKEIRELDEYSVPQEDGLVKLNQNESPYDIPIRLKETIAAKWVRADWFRYPKPAGREFQERLASYAGHPPEGILLGVGSNELIQSIFLTILEKGQKLFLPEPGFTVYERLGRILKADIVKFELDREFRYGVKNILRALRAVRPRLSVFPSPHNPCGCTLGLGEIEQILNESPGLVVMDEAYYEFSGQTAKSLLDTYDNLMILRTFSKAFGLAGLRAGYLLGRPEAVEQVAKVQMPFSVSTFNRLAISGVLEQRGYVQRTVRSVCRERERVMDSLSGMRGIKAFPSQANFILFRTEGLSARRVWEGLKERKILVRPFPTRRLANCLRLTLGRRRENRMFLDALKEVLDEE